MSHDPRTPGRAAPVGAALAQHDLLRRLRALGLSAEAEPRVLRFLQRELEQALERANDQRWTAEEISEAGGDEASTVLDLTGSAPEVLRWGAVAADALEPILRDLAGS